jgi:hypothetical protein
MWSLGFGRLITTAIAEATRAILGNIAGRAGSEDGATADSDETGERATEQEMFSGPGLVVRPRSKTTGGCCEVVYIDTGDGIVPIAYRDLRLNGLFGAPKEGTVSLVGYAGAFDSNDPTFDETTSAPKSSVRTIYVPYAFAGGRATKAHAIVIDGTAGNESIAIVHGQGMAVILHAGSAVIKNAAGDAYVEVKASGIVLNGNTVLNGGATIGSPAGALPAAKAGPILTYLGALEALLGTIAAATTPPTSAAVTAFVSAQAATKALIAATKASVA